MDPTPLDPSTLASLAALVDLVGIPGALLYLGWVLQRVHKCTPRVEVVLVEPVVIVPPKADGDG